MNKLVIATCLFGFIALVSADLAPKQCLQYLADEFDEIEVPKPVSDYVAHLDSVLPVDAVKQEWDEAEFKKIESKVVFPWMSCFDYVDDVSSAYNGMLSKHEDCTEVINKALGEPRHDDDQALKELRKGVRDDEILGPKTKSFIACAKFKPYRDLESLPRCLQKIVYRAQEVYVPEELKQFVVEARTIRGSANHETIQRFGTPERRKKCAAYVKLVDKFRLKALNEECPQDWNKETMSPNKIEKLRFVLYEDDTYAMACSAQSFCKALLTPGFQIGGENPEYISLSW